MNPMPIVTKQAVQIPDNAMFLQRVDNRRWEEIDQHCWDNWENAVLTDGSPRYNGNRFQIVNGKVNIEATLSFEDASILARIAGFNAHQGSQPKGFVDEPEFIPFNIKRGAKVKTVIRQVGVEGEFVQTQLQRKIEESDDTSLKQLA
jgi:hypothetical protein